MTSADRGWKRRKLRHCVTVDPAVPAEVRNDPERTATFLPMEAVGEQGELDLTRETSVGSASSGYTFVTDGDVLVAKVTPCFENGKGAIAAGLRNGLGFATTEVYALRPNGQIDARFLDYLLRSTVFRQYGTARLTGAGGLKRISATDLRNFTFTLPSVEEQRGIADFLDRETARIDTLIEEQQRLIELLRERRATVVSSAFLDHDPNSRIQHACIDVVDCPHTTPKSTVDGAYEAVRTASVRDGKFRPNNGISVNRETWISRNAGGAPNLGDVLFTREAPAGEACMVPSTDVCLGQRMVLLRVNPETCRGRFMVWQIYSDRVQDHFRLSVNGSTVGNIRLPVLRSTPIWLPSLEDQHRIVTFLDEQTSKIDTLITAAERFIDLVRERRAALITAAVTGQIDVRDEVA